MRGDDVQNGDVSQVVDRVDLFLLTHMEDSVVGSPEHEVFGLADNSSTEHAYPWVVTAKVFDVGHKGEKREARSWNIATFGRFSLR